MDWLNMTNSSMGPKLVRVICSVLPRNQAYQLGDRLTASLINQKENDLVKGLQTNMAAVCGVPEDHPRVQRAIRRQFRSLVRAYVDFYKALEIGPQGIFASCQFDEGLLGAVDSCMGSGRGLLLAGIHTCSFDLLLLALSNYLPQIQVLTKSDPKGNSVVMNKIRKEFGLHVTPISTQALKEAIQRLKSGGVVVIAADVPVGGGAEMIFFRRKTRMPIGHARLALKTNARMIVGASVRVSDGLYRAIGVQSRQPTPTGDQDQDAIRWAQHSLFLLESFIRERPHEWFMPNSLWPEPAVQGTLNRSFLVSMPGDRSHLSAAGHCSNTAEFR